MLLSATGAQLIRLKPEPPAQRELPAPWRDQAVDPLAVVDRDAGEREHEHRHAEQDEDVGKIQRDRTDNYRIRDTAAVPMRRDHVAEHTARDDARSHRDEPGG